MHISHTVATAEALFRVFISNVPRTHIYPVLKPTQWHLNPLFSHTTLRHYSPRHRYHEQDEEEAGEQKSQKPKGPYVRQKKTFGPQDTRRYNERIQSEYVRLIEKDGSFTTRKLKSLLSEIDRRTETIMQASPNDDTEGFPIVRILPSREAHDRDKSREKANRHNPSSASKQIELTWLIGPNDLDNMMSQLKGFLEDGKRVEIGIGRNKRKGQAKRTFTIEQARSVLNGVRERIGNIEGAAEYKEMEQGKGAAVLFVESKAMKAEAERKRKEVEKEKEEVRKRKLDEKERRRGGVG